MATVRVCAVISSTTPLGRAPDQLGHLVEVGPVERTGEDDETSLVVAFSRTAELLVDELRQLGQPSPEVCPEVSYARVEEHHDGGQSPDDVVQPFETSPREGHVSASGRPGDRPLR